MASEDSLALIASDDVLIAPTTLASPVPSGPELQDLRHASRVAMLT
jgi:hypothetical protein